LLEKLIKLVQFTRIQDEIAHSCNINVNHTGFC
jgi:hypothetical protein